VIKGKKNIRKRGLRSYAFSSGVVHLTWIACSLKALRTPFMCCELDQFYTPSGFNLAKSLLSPKLSKYFHFHLIKVIPFMLEE